MATLSHITSVTALTLDTEKPNDEELPFLCYTWSWVLLSKQDHDNNKKATYISGDHY